MITELLIILLIIIIIILFYKLFEYENFVENDMKPNLDKTALKEEDNINNNFTIKNNNTENKEIDNKKEEKTELGQDINIEIKPKNDNDFSYNTTKHDINKLEENLKNEEIKKNIKKEEIKENKEINNKLDYTADISTLSNEMNKRYENQPEEYKQSFKDTSNTGYIYKDTVITDENIYTFDGFNYMSAHQLYIPTNYKTKPEDYGRNYIPPELWYKNNQRLNLPVCYPANGRCLIKDVPTTGYPIDVVEWHSSRKVLNPDGINIKYIREKLNTNHDD